MLGRKLAVTGIVAAALIISAHARTPSPAEGAFHKLQSLAGDWEGKRCGRHRRENEFQSCGRKYGRDGNNFTDAHGEMVTLYSLDGNSIALVHYCPTNNQPHMQANPGVR